MSEINDTTVNTEMDFVVQLLTENEANVEFHEANSATVANPAVTWAKFVLTDDKPNGNNMRVPLEEFPNLIKSGVYMPIKMAKGEIKPGHEVAEPLGVITNLKSVFSEKNGNQIIGLAALWLREREKDVEYLKERAKTKEPITLSWEILYKGFDIVNGIKELKDTYLKASTIVGRPAYGDRTPILALAEKGSSAFLDELPDTSFLYVSEKDGIKDRKFPYMDSNGNVDKELLTSSISELEKESTQEFGELLAKANEILNNRVEEKLEHNTEENKLEELETLKTELENTRKDLEAVKALLAEKETAAAEKDAELSSLREFKAGIEAKASEDEKLSSIKTKFETAGIAKPEAYFEEKKTFLLGMSDEELDFMLQELVAFAAAKDSKESTATSSTSIPNLGSNREVVTSNVKAIAQALRARK